MKLVLLQDVKNVGKKGDLVDAADGYARNYLLPRKLAVAATEGIMKSRDKEAADLKARKLREKEQAQELAATLEGSPVQLKVRVGDNGKLFGSVTSSDIASAIKDQLRHNLDKKHIQLKDPLKALGEHVVPVKLHPEVQAKIRLVLAASSE
jgi:large subunit ribosomal protein L9